MSEHRFTLALIKNSQLRLALAEGADEGVLADALGSASERLELSCENRFDLDLFDTLSRVNWGDEYGAGKKRYRLASPDECELGATRLADLLEEPRKLARGMKVILEEEAEVELSEDEIATLTEMLSDADATVEAAADSVVECAAQYVLLLSQALQGAADHDRWLVAVLE